MSSSSRTRRKPKINSLALVLVFLINLVNLIVGSPVSHTLQYSQFQSARNIRHLPCVVRRSGLKGVCMFAIDCLKANGTHLGTCIDKFYFGSCCQIKEIDSIYNPDLSDNRIDSGYEKPYSSVTTLAVPSSSYTSTSVHPSSSPSYSSWKTTTARPSTNSINIRNTTYELVSTSSSYSASPSTEKYGSFSTTMGLTVHRNASTTFGLRDDPNEATTENIKLSTYQSVQESQNKTETPEPETTSYIELTTTRPIIQTTTTNRTVTATRKPITTKITGKPSSRPTARPSVTKATSRPTPSKRPVSQTTLNKINATTTTSGTSATSAPPRRTTTKPIKISSIKTTQKPTATTQKVTKVTRRPVNATATKPTTKITRKPTTTPSTVKVPATTSETLTTVSFVETTKAPRPRPKPTGEIVKVESTTLFDEDLISTTFIVEPAETTTTTTKRTTTTTTKRVPTRTTTRRTSTSTKPAATTNSPVSEPVKVASTSRRPPASSTGTRRPTKQPEPTKATSPLTRRPPVTTSKTTTKKPESVSTMGYKNRTEAPYRPTESTMTSHIIQADATTAKPSGLITWTAIESEEDNATKGNEWILISSVSPSSYSTTRLPVDVDSDNLIKTDDAEDDRLTTVEEITTQRIITNQAQISDTQSTTESLLASSMSTVSSTLSSMLSTFTSYLPLSTKANITTTFSTHPSSSALPSSSPLIHSRPQIVVWTTSPMTTPTTTSTTPSTTTVTKPTTSVSSTTEESEEEDEDEDEEEEGEGTTEAEETEETEENEIEDETTTEFVSEAPETTKEPEKETDVTKEEIYPEDMSSSTAPTTINETTTFETTSSAFPSLEGIDYKQICGKRMYPEPRIVGGSKSAFGRWPWQISLRQWRTSTYLHKCGAALLNENWAITAAHCVDNVPPSDLLLRLGEYDLSIEEEPYGYQERRVQIVASHPQFDPRTFEYDLALLRFYEPVTFQPNIIPVCVPETDENFIGRTAYVTGWGRLYEDGPLPSVLQQVEVPVIENHLCEGMYRQAGYIEHIPHIFICAGWKKGGFDSCEGDSGGPMVIQRDDKRFILSGVISWGIGCAEPNQPGVYTRISEFRDWINQILQF